LLILTFYSPKINPLRGRGGRGEWSKTAAQPWQVWLFHSFGQGPPAAPVAPC
jgi:hypothetical protein